MNFYIQQSIHINLIKIGSITNSSVLQIGSSGIIKPATHLFNTGGFIKPAPKADKPGTDVSGTPGTDTGSSLTVPSVPISIS
jgi:spore germination protein PB